MNDLNGKNAVVTGAASGIGLALCEQLAAEGMNLVIADVNHEALTEAANKLKSTGATVTSIVTDVSDADSVKQLAKASVEVLGEIHLLCNNAGVINAASLWESTLDEYNWVMGVNLWGVIHGIREFVPVMKAQSCESHILNTASMGALVSLPYSGIYYMTKAAALSLSETLYQELMIEAPHVGVTALCPEFVKTNIAKAERNRPVDADFSNTDMKGLILQNLSDYTTSDEAISASDLALRGIEAIKKKRFYAITTEQNPWYTAMNARFNAIRESGVPPFVVPTEEGVAGLKAETSS